VDLSNQAAWIPVSALRACPTGIKHDVRKAFPLDRPLDGNGIPPTVRDLREIILRKSTRFRADRPVGELPRSRQVPHIQLYRTGKTIYTRATMSNGKNLVRSDRRARMGDRSALTIRPR